MLRSQDHTKFRRSKKWQNFRKAMLKEHPCCAFCSSNRATRTVHHIYNCETEEEYEDLTPTRFIVLCSQCHSFLHWIGRKKDENPSVTKVKEIALNIGFGADWVIFY